MSRAGRRAVGAGAGLLADMALGDRPLRPHPVAAFGALMQEVEGRLYRDSRGAGVLHAAVGAAAGAGAGAALQRALGRKAAGPVATYVAVAHRQLATAARDVAARLGADDLEGARAGLPALVGRDPDGLDEKEISRAVVESVAENTVDAVVAPVLWAVAGGAPGVWAYRAVNTMDAMVGHRSPRHLRYGWAAARLDDGANWVPARLTAALVAACRPRRAREVWRAVRHDAPAHPSPNAGVAEAAFAAALGVRLGGTNRYGHRVEVRPSLGDGRAPDRSDIVPAVRLARDVSRALTGTVVLLGLLAP
ncbi:MAG TPA: adenosylcobinamide-phosphate synthase CbiB [Acidimicrobiales bacterium]|nr:adenosylcobinamide-phosphate synthase CbiB [Acidimicrobiales bacterium]